MKNPNKADLKTVVKTVREIVRQRPDVRYQAKHVCSYISGACTDGSVGCLIGQALVKLGVEIELGESTKRISDVAHVFCDDATQELSKYNNVASVWLMHVQSAQDREEPWIDCVTYADTSAGRTEGIIP